MKKFFTQFRASIILGMALLASLTNVHDISVFAETTLEPDSAPPNQTIDQSAGVSADMPAVTSNADLTIKAINPGYTVDGIQNVGEFIELQKNTDASLSLANYSIHYITSSGKETTLLNFSKGESLVGEFLLMRLSRSPDSEQSDATYTTTLAMGAGTVEVLYNDIVIDSVCWGGKNDACHPAFKSSQPTTLVRSLDSDTFEHLSEYVPSFDPANPSLLLPPVSDSDEPNGSETGSTDGPDLPSAGEERPDLPDLNEDDPEPEQVTSKCRGLEFSELLSYYAEDKTEQFIELFNSTEHSINLGSCQLRYKNKTYKLAGTVQPNAYFVIRPSQFSPAVSFTKNPSSTNLIELLDIDRSVVDALAYPHGQKKSTSYARFYDATGEAIWDLTYSITPDLENNYQEFRTCPVGKVINPDTGNCVKVSTTSTAENLAACPAGKYRNPLTGRCKNIETNSTEPKPCAEGYERNPETNRCRKVVAENSGAGYALVPTTSSSKSTFVALGVVVLIIGAGIIYIVLQFRHEIARAIRKIKQRLHHIR